MKKSFLAGLILLTALGSYCEPVLSQQGTQAREYPVIDLAPFRSSASHWYGIYDKHNVVNYLPGKPVYRDNEITKIADNILLFQKNNGGWPKNYDMQAILSPAQADSVHRARNVQNTTFDNSTTYTQIDYLAQVYNITKDAKYKEGCLKGLQFCIDAQYSNGGWPQYYPVEPKNYSRRITYNDGAYIGIMQLLRKVVMQDSAYRFVSPVFRSKVEAAYRKGIECILNTQISENGVLTAWCQQHDEVTLAPAWARAFEPPSICNAESAAIVSFLMQIDKPDARVIKAVQSAVKWFDASKILNTRIETIKSAVEKTKYTTMQTDKVVVTDSTAAPVWTRYYELGTHRPLFCDRDSKFRYSLAEVSRERRVGYGWYTYSPQSILKKYPKWQKKWAPTENVLDK